MSTARRAGGRGHEDESHDEPDERWAVSYADMVTVLMCLFIVLFAVSNVDKTKFELLANSLATGFGQEETTTGGADISEGLVIPPEMLDEEGEPDRVGELGLGRGVGRTRPAHGGSRRVTQRLRVGDVPQVLAAGRPGSQHVEADPRDDGREPATEVGDVARVGAAHAQPGLLDGVVGLGRGAEHAVGDGAQVPAVLLEAPRQPVGRRSGVRLHGRVTSFVSAPSSV